MSKQTKNTLGSFGKMDGSFSMGLVMLTFSSDKHGETLSLAFMDECQFTLRYQAIQTVANRVKTQIQFGVQQAGDGYWEQEALTTGLYVSGKGSPIPQKGEIHINLRSNGKDEMLSIAFEDKGEISVSYLPVKDLVEKARDRQN